MKYLLLFLFSFTLFAQAPGSIDISSLPDVQRAAILKQIEEEKVKHWNATHPQNATQQAQETAKQMDSYAQIAERFSNMMPVFAKNLACSVDSVMNSWTGRVLVVSALCYIFGGKIFGVLILIIGSFLWW